MSAGYYGWEEQTQALAELRDAGDRAAHRAHREQPIPFRVRVLARSPRAWRMRLEDDLPAGGTPDQVEAWIPVSALRVQHDLQVDPEAVVEVEIRRWVAAQRGWTVLGAP